MLKSLYIDLPVLYNTRMPTEHRLAKIQTVVNQRQEGIVVLEDIHDPHNAEAVIRSCESFGIQTVCFIFHTQKPFNPAKVGKASSANANKWLDYRIFSHVNDCFSELKSEGYTLYGTVLADDAQSMYETTFPHPKTALVFGNEAKGMSEDAIQGVDHKIIIPMQGMVQSLNLSVTAGIFLFELNRQRRQLGMEKFLLPVEQKTILEQSFLDR